MNECSILVGLTVGPLTPGDSAHQVAVDEFRDLAGHTDGLTLGQRTLAPAAGTKGGWEQIFITVSSSAAVVRLFRLWLQRDRRRSITVEIESEQDEAVTLTVNGEAVSLDALQRAVDAALKQSRKKLE